MTDVESDSPGQTVRSLIDAQQYQLMIDAVQPIDAQPIYTSAFERYLLFVICIIVVIVSSFVRITVDTIRLSNGSDAYIIFVLTESGLLHKLGAIRYDHQSFGDICTIEIVQISEHRRLSSTGHFQLHMVRRLPFEITHMYHYYRIVFSSVSIKR